MKFEIRIVTHFKMGRVRRKDCTMYYLPLGLRSWRGMVNPAIRLRVTRAQGPQWVGRVPDKIEPLALVRGHLCAAHASVNPKPGTLIPMCEDPTCMFGNGHVTWDAL